MGESKVGGEGAIEGAGEMDTGGLSVVEVHVLLADSGTYWFDPGLCNRPEALLRWLRRTVMNGLFRHCVPFKETHTMRP